MSQDGSPLAEDLLDATVETPEPGAKHTRAKKPVRDYGPSITAKRQEDWEFPPSFSEADLKGRLASVTLKVPTRMMDAGGALVHHPGTPFERIQDVFLEGGEMAIKEANSRLAEPDPRVAAYVQTQTIARILRVERAALEERTTLIAHAQEVLTSHISRGDLDQAAHLLDLTRREIAAHPDPRWQARATLDLERLAVVAALVWLEGSHGRHNGHA